MPIGPQAAPGEFEPSMPRDPVPWAIVLLAALTVGISIWWATGIGDSTLSSRLVGAVSALGGLIVVFMAVRLRKTERLDPPIRRAWSIIAVSLAVYGAGVLIRFAATSMPAVPLLAPLGVGLSIAFYPLITTALSLLPKPSRTRYDLLLFSLDVTVAAASAAILLWHFSIFPTARDNGQDALTAILVAFYPVYDAALVFSMVAMVVRGLPDSTRMALAIAAVAFSAIFVADMIAGLERLEGTYVGGGLSGFFYSIAGIGLAVAAYAQWRVKDRPKPLGGIADYARSFPWLPYAAVAVAFVAPAVRDWNDADMLRQHVPATGLLIALIVARLGITARHDASLAAAERERLATAVDQAAELIITADLSRRVTYVNPASTRIMGYEAAEILGKTQSFFADTADPGAVAELTAALARGESWAGRLPHRKRDGTTVELDMTVSPLRDATGLITGTVAVARDISREKTLEAQLAQAQRMEAIGRLAGGVAHDFNNILTAIGGFSQLAASELGPGHPVSADIDQIRHAADRAAALTRSLLIFSRRQITQSRAVDLNDVLAGLTPMLGRLIGEDVQLIVRVDPRLGLTLADAGQLEQVVLDLAVNARDAMPDGGTLTISTANADVDAAFARDHVGATAGKFVVLIVSDTGTGMTPEVMEHAFEPFFTTKEQGKGTGLGLSTAFGIVQAGSGFIRVESEPNAGSVFSVYLPRLDGTRPQPLADVADQPKGGKEAILVAEDEDAVRKFVERVLRGAGYRVRVASNGEEAVELAAQMQALDLLVTDVVMPGMNGVQLAAHLTKARPDLPVLYASGYSDEGVPRGAGLGDRVSYLPKPFTAEALLARIRETLDRGPDAADSTADELVDPE